MPFIPLDTQMVAYRLASAGIPDQHVNAILAVMLDLHRHQEEAFKADIVKLEASIESSTARAKSEVLTWVMRLAFYMQAMLTIIVLVAVLA